MKSILREYGTSLLAVLTAGLLFFFCLSGIKNSQGESGIYAVLKQSVRQKEVVFTDDMDRISYAEFMSRGNPVIYCQPNGIYAGENVNWQTVFPAEDVEQNVLAVQIVSIDGNKNISNDYQFAKSGIYIVEVLAVDAKQKQTKKVFQLPVLPKKIRGVEEGN